MAPVWCWSNGSPALDFCCPNLDIGRNFSDQSEGREMAMSDPAKKEREPEETAKNETDQAVSEVATEAAGAEGDYEVVVRLVKENEELKDRALRVAADMENLRRRTA